MQVLPQVLPQALQQAGVAGGKGTTMKPGSKEHVTQLEQRLKQMEQMMGMPSPSPAPAGAGGAEGQPPAQGLGPGSGQPAPAQASGPLSPQAGQLMQQPLPAQGMIQTASLHSKVQTGQQLHDVVMALLR